jgi:hypothetical protein
MKMRLNIVVLSPGAALLVNTVVLIGCSSSRYSRSTGSRVPTQFCRS